MWVLFWIFFFLRLITGQFAQEPQVKVYGVHEGADPKKKEATMEVKGNKLAVTRYYHMQISLFFMASYFYFLLTHKNTNHRNCATH